MAAPIEIKMLILNCLRLNYWSFKKIETPKLLWFHLFVEIKTGFLYPLKQKILKWSKAVLFEARDSAKSLMIEGDN